jgi:uncharacterized protein
VPVLQNPHGLLGTIIEGSLSGGLKMRLAPEQSVEEIRVGQFVVIEGQLNRFFCMITDVELTISNPRILLNPPAQGDFLAQILQGTGTLGTVSLQPMLMLAKNADNNQEELRPVKTIPAHFAPVQVASEQDFATVFGTEQDLGKARFFIGQPLDMDVPLCLDLDRFVERSNAIFGKSGTGKSFLTRLVLSGIIKKQVAVNLVFDMHNEYGWQAMSENKSEKVVKGLKQLFGRDVVVFTLDLKSSRQRGIKDAQELTIPLRQIQIEDLALIKQELNLSEASIESAMILEEAFGKNWLKQFVQMSASAIEEFVASSKGHVGALKALQRKLIKVTQLSYIKEESSADAIKMILQYLENGKHVVLEFGGHNSLLSYMLATNIITRRIHQSYVDKSDIYNADPNNNIKPRQLVITIEEAHKFLAPSIARQTIFGTIAREMRKYSVTLLIVDQRPSSIDNEILSQVGTRITALLNDDKDIDAVFTGVSGSQSLRTVLSQLDPKQQALILGYAVPMPVVMRTRAYNTDFYKAVGYTGDEKPEELEARAQNNIIRLFPG